MSRKGQILLASMLGHSTQGSMLKFESKISPAISQNSLENELLRLSRSIEDIEEMQETTPEFCIHPQNWYRQLAA